MVKIVIKKPSVVQATQPAGEPSPAGSRDVSETTVPSRSPLSSSAAPDSAPVVSAPVSVVVKAPHSTAPSAPASAPGGVVNAPHSTAPSAPGVVVNAPNSAAPSAPSVVVPKRNRPGARRHVPPPTSVATATQQHVTNTNTTTTTATHTPSLLDSLLTSSKQIASAKNAVSAANTGPAKDAQQKADARRAFEVNVRNALLENFPPGGEDTGAVYDFPPMDKAWRSVVHDIVEELGLHSEGEGVEGVDRHVQVSRTQIMTEEALEKEALRRDRLVRAVAARGGGVAAGSAAAAPGANLSLKAVAADDAMRVLGGSTAAITTLNTVKRDLRTIEEIQGDMKRRKLQ